MDRSDIEARARAEALVREELARRETLRREVAALAERAGPLRRLAAALAGTRLVGLLAGDRRIGGRRGSPTEREGAELRQRRFRLSRRRRVLARGAPTGEPSAPRRERRRPGWRQRLLAERMPRVLVDPECPGAVDAAVAELGLERAGSSASAEVAIAVDAAGRLSFDWILAGERSAASSEVRVERLAGPEGGRALADALRASAQSPTFCIRLAGRDWEAAERGGDAALARSLARALGERGHQALLRVGGEAANPAGDGLDVLLALRGRPLGEPTPDRLNLIWQISHPEETSAEELDRYDRVLVASRPHAERLRGTIRPPVEPLLQFTDPALFHPAADVTPEHDVAFVGNWRGEFRRIVWDAIQAGHPPALYGRGWDLLAPEHALAEHVPHAELARLYSSCEILLCDHWEDMRRLGYVSNRVFDALACGAFVIADDNPGLAEELPGVVPTYSSPGELRDLLERHLGDPEGRRRMAARGREATLAKHTVEQRAERLLAIAAATARQCDRPQLAHLREAGQAGWSGAPGAGASAVAAAPRAVGGGSA